jgi:hypothetical protein
MDNNGLLPHALWDYLSREAGSVVLRSALTPISINFKIPL